ncbi:hypothetical protein BC940DRAFT_312892 [Gongronella butleri]|nr:hypothetical protein BC940DRAFT_312892 [Gongronella butleri]
MALITRSGFRFALSTHRSVQQCQRLCQQRLLTNKNASPNTHTHIGGVFEPFLNTIKQNDANETITSLERLSSSDILPSKEQLALHFKDTPDALTGDQCREAVEYILKQLQDKNAIETARIAEMFGNDASQITKLGNILLQNSKDSTPVTLELYRQAMLLGDDQGTFSFASIIYRGFRGTPKDEAQGIQLLSALAKKGHPYAQMDLASIIMRSHPERIQDAIQLYKLAGKAGVTAAYVELGRMYRIGYGVHQDHDQALAYFQQGVDNGDDPQCHFMLGSYYAASKMADDQSKAFKHYQVAAAKGIPEAQYNVAMHYLKGLGVQANAFNAVEFFTMAATQGFQIAQVNLANMYRYGNGIKKDIGQARHWLEKAVAIGGPVGDDAQKQLDELQPIKSERGTGACVIM